MLFHFNRLNLHFKIYSTWLLENLSIYEAAWVGKSCSTVIFMKSEHRSSIPGENLASRLRFAPSVKIHTEGWRPSF